MESWWQLASYRAEPSCRRKLLKMEIARNTNILVCRVYGCQILGISGSHTLWQLGSYNRNAVLITCAYSSRRQLALESEPSSIDLIRCYNCGELGLHLVTGICFPSIPRSPIPTCTNNIRPVKTRNHYIQCSRIGYYFWMVKQSNRSAKLYQHGWNIDIIEIPKLFSVNTELSKFKQNQFRYYTKLSKYSYRASQFRYYPS